jgi:hypothetical protein
MSEKREAAYWGAENQEQLSLEDVDEAIEEILGDAGKPDLLPAKIKIYGYAPMELEIPDILDDILEGLDEELGDPDGNPTEPTPVMIFAANTLRDAIEQEYHVWACEMIETREIDVAEWVGAHRADWLADGVRIEG